MYVETDNFEFNPELSASLMSLRSSTRSNSTRSLSPERPSRRPAPFGRDLDLDDEFSVGSSSSIGFRTGGPKEARLKRVALLSNAKEVEHLHAVKVQNLPRTASAEKLQAEFGEFGQLGDVYVPVNMRDCKPAKDFAILRFTDKKAADALLNSPEKTSTKSLDGHPLSVSPMTKQKSFFSHNTGRLGISNEVIHHNDYQRGGMLEQHISLSSVRSRAGYPWGSVRELKYLNPKPDASVLELFTIKLVNLPRHLTEEQLYAEFIRYGDLASLSVPKSIVVTAQTKDANMGHAFVRYADRRDMAAAAKDLKAGKIQADGHVLEGEELNPPHWPTDKSRRYY